MNETIDKPIEELAENYCICEFAMTHDDSTESAIAYKAYIQGAKVQKENDRVDKAKALEFLKQELSNKAWDFIYWKIQDYIRQDNRGINYINETEIADDLKRTLEKVKI